ncbi:right-handed parallel beta-helix repeat-containing protein [Candidatus Bathyarchaeota archaeon]|nr:right-handed parallel beta-helix repeat-containing protein [Candidatus Bathyarchaeota archaeon]
MRRIVSKLFLVLLVLALLRLTSQIHFAEADSRTIVVPDDFQKIQEAINNAADGDLIFVKSGVYAERLTVNITISLLGESSGKVIVESGKGEDTILLQADNVSVSGFSIRNMDRSTSSFGMRLSNSSFCTISNNIVSDTFAAVMIEGGSSNLVEHNYLENNRYGIFTRRYLHLCPSNSNVLVNNTIVNSTWNALELDWGEGNTVRNNNVFDNTAYALEIPIYAPSYNNVIFHNNFVGNAKAWGVTCQAYGPSPNRWDKDGDGNYWSDYTGIDVFGGPFQNTTGSDGIGDSPHISQEDTTDHYPLMGLYRAFEVGGEEVAVICNSSLASLDFASNGSRASVVAFVSQEEGSEGFCRFSLPIALINGTYETRLDNQTVNYPTVTALVWPNATRECLLVKYGEGEHSISIRGTTQVSEFPSLLMLAIFLVMACGFSLLFRRKRV